MWAMTWFVSSATAAEASAEPHASFHFRGVPGRASSHRATVARAKSGIDHVERRRDMAEPGVVRGELVDPVVEGVVHVHEAWPLRSRGQWVAATVVSG